MENEIGKKIVLQKLQGMMNQDGDTIIKNPWKIDSIESLLNEIETQWPEILQEAVNLVKNAIQREAAKFWYSQNAWAILAMATGTGKSKIPINILEEAFRNRIAAGSYNIDPPRVLLIVPTERLRDEDWKAEFEKWKLSMVYETVERTCYASLDNYEGKTFDLVVGDEFHNITIDKAEFFRKNTVHRLICLTATPPTDVVKLKILKDLNIPIAYNVPLDIAVRLKMVAPYKVTIVECRLDNVIKNIKGGTKAAPFMTTELQAYNYKTKLFNSAVNGRLGPIVTKHRIIDRMRFIKTLESRTKNAKFILSAVSNPEAKTLIFCGGIEQAIELSPYRYFSKPSCKKTDPAPKRERVARLLSEYQGDESLTKFCEGQINQLACVEALNEGANIPKIKRILIAAIESGDKTVTQQIGRAVRFEIGHEAEVIIIVYTDTVDEKWLESALVNLNPMNIRRVRMANLIAGVDKL